MTSPNDTIDEWPPDKDPTDYSFLTTEPMVDVPAGLLGTAIELLDLCDELVNRPGSSITDAWTSAVIGHYQRATTTTILRWFHDSLGVTAFELQQLLDDRGIIVEPTLRGRPTPHHRRHAETGPGHSACQGRAARVRPTPDNGGTPTKDTALGPPGRPANETTEWRPNSPPYKS
jgi:hypothetical protein